MPYADNDGVAICYEFDGDRDDPLLLLISGLGNQMTSWPDEFCQSLLDRGFALVRYDHRDCGLSTAFAEGDAYSLDDMASDAVAVLDALDADAAHVFGHSMGGMIAQILAIRFPDRVRTLSLLSTNSGNEAFGTPTDEVLVAMSRPPSDDPAVNLAHDIANRRIWASPAWFDEAQVTAEFEAAYARSFVSGGSLRQLTAILLASERDDALRSLMVPTLVMHGTLDPLISSTGGERIAQLVPDAELLLLEGLAHDLPVEVWQPVISAITNRVVHAGT